MRAGPRRELRVRRDRAGSRPSTRMSVARRHFITSRSRQVSARPRRATSHDRRRRQHASPVAGTAPERRLGKHRCRENSPRMTSQEDGRRAAGPTSTSASRVGGGTASGHALRAWRFIDREKIAVSSRLLSGGTRHARSHEASVMMPRAADQQLLEPAAGGSRADASRASRC